MAPSHPIMHVLRPGLFTTIQDLGRVGYQRFGVSVGGAMDRWALTVGNRLLGNPDHAAGLECTIQGPELLFEQPTLIALTGADLSPTCDGAALPMWTVVVMAAGSRLQFGARRQGARAYLAVAGGLDCPMILGSRSTHVRSGLGGLSGRALAKHDQLPIGRSGRFDKPVVGRTLSVPQRPTYSTETIVRVMPGPQHDRFIDGALEDFVRAPYHLTGASDRMGYRLQGAPLTHRASPDILSDAVMCGAIQVPADRQPILLMADCQTTGGYAKLAVMAAVDRSAAAQLAPGDHLRFTLVTAEQAADAWRTARHALDTLLPPMIPSPRRVNP